MTTLLIKKLNKEMQDLKGDVLEMKRFLFAPLRDGEGEYTESFVKKMLARSHNRGPWYRFGSKQSFLKHVTSKK